MKVHHLLCGSLQAPSFGYVPCRGLLLAGEAELVLVDTGIGSADVRNPLERIGRELIELAGFSSTRPTRPYGRSNGWVTIRRMFAGSC